jgi:hypothetical protein
LVEDLAVGIEEDPLDLGTRQRRLGMRLALPVVERLAGALEDLERPDDALPVIGVEPGSRALVALGEFGMEVALGGAPFFGDVGRDQGSVGKPLLQRLEIEPGPAGDDRHAARPPHSLDLGRRIGKPARHRIGA